MLFLDRSCEIWEEFGSICTEIGRNPGEEKKGDFWGANSAESLGMDSAYNSQGGDDGSPGSGYAINGEIMMAAIAVLFTVILFIVCLHVYAKWFWRQSGRVIIYRRRGRRRGSWSLRRFAFVGAEDAGQGEDPDNVGLDKPVIESLPLFVYQSGRQEEGLDCAVCLCEFEENEKGRLLPTCNHSFHVGCIEMWLLSHSTCPLCRTRVQADRGSPTPPGNVAEEFAGGGDEESAVRAAFGANCEEIGENSGSAPPQQQEEGEASAESAKISVKRLRSLKKLLGRENRVFPSDPDGGDIEHGGQPVP